MSALCSPAGKVAFVTGGSSGIGLGVAKAFLDAGLKVAIGYRTVDHLDEALRMLGGESASLIPIRVDVTDRAAMEAAAAQVKRCFGTVHVLVNNAGIATIKTLSDTSYEEWDRALRVNLSGVFNGIQAFLPVIQANQEGGHIVATSSVLGLHAGRGMGPYCATKFGVVGLMETLKAELEGTNVGVSVYCPGVVQSNLLSRGTEAAAMATSAARQAATDDISTDPLHAGLSVLNGILRNDFYILSHSEFRHVIRSRHEAIEASFSPDSPSLPRLDLGARIASGAIYKAILDKLRKG